HMLRELLRIEPEAVIDEDREVSRGGAEAVDVLHEEECLEHWDSEHREVRSVVREVLLGGSDGSLSCGVPSLADAGEGIVEGGDLTDLGAVELFGNLLHDAEHRALAD